MAQTLEFTIPGTQTKVPVLLVGGAALVIAFFLLARRGSGTGDEPDPTGLLASELDQRIKEIEDMFKEKEPIPPQFYTEEYTLNPEGTDIWYKVIKTWFEGQPPKYEYVPITAPVQPAPPGSPPKIGDDLWVPPVTNVPTPTVPDFPPTDLYRPPAPGGDDISSLAAGANIVYEPPTTAGILIGSPSDTLAFTDLGSYYGPAKENSMFSSPPRKLSIKGVDTE